MLIAGSCNIATKNGKYIFNVTNQFAENELGNRFESQKCSSNSQLNSVCYIKPDHFLRGSCLSFGVV